MTYKLFVEEVSREDGPSQVILNRSPKHAAVIMSQIFTNARDFVKILTGALSNDVYGDAEVIAAATNFLRNRDAKLLVLSESLIDREHNLLLQAIEVAGFSSKVYTDVVPIGEQAAYSFHFAVNDRGDYRFEEDRAKREAIVQFKEPEFAGTLSQIFLSLAGSSGQLRAAI